MATLAKSVANRGPRFNPPGSRRPQLEGNQRMAHVREWGMIIGSDLAMWQGQEVASEQGFSSVGAGRFEPPSASASRMAVRL